MVVAVMTLAPSSDSPFSGSVPALSPAVYIVGAGPGDPELMTVKAQRLLSQADVILYADSLVPRQVVQQARSDAEVIRTANIQLD